MTALDSLRRPLRTALLALAHLAFSGALLLLPAEAAALSAPPAKSAQTKKATDSAKQPQQPRQPGLSEQAGPALPAAPGHAAESTQCAVCHTVRGWREVAFDHARTGFPLIGAHQTALCSRCHGGDLAHPVPKGCAACHRDAHVGEFGSRCSSCHEESSWRPFFSVDAHRRTNFPLTGRHALIPCEQCHTNVRDRSYTRTTVACFDCHQADYARTSLGSAPDHAANNFPTTCRSCHATFQWKGARFPAHDACFELSGGPHQGIACLDCHTSLPRNSVPGTCATNSAACTRCHQCTSNQVVSRHVSVAGFQCKDRKCWECHKFSSAQLLGAPRPLRSR